MARITGPREEDLRAGVAVSRISRRVRVCNVMTESAPEPIGFWTSRAERRMERKRRR